MRSVSGFMLMPTIPTIPFIMAPAQSTTAKKPIAMAPAAVAARGGQKIAIATRPAIAAAMKRTFPEMIKSC